MKLFTARPGKAAASHYTSYLIDGGFPQEAGNPAPETKEAARFFN